MSNSIIFPNPKYADDDGLLAYGGDLSIDTLIAAYSQGIFPWYSENEPILWWSPDPRMVLFVDKLYVSKRLHRKIRQQGFEIKMDTCFEKVMQQCAFVKRKGQLSGTWIIDEMISAYNKLHEAGYAHSIEVFKNQNLVGGIYGISLGRAFFGESMFHTETDASKIALFYLVKQLKQLNIEFLDTQQVSSHMKSMGAEEIKRSQFLSILKKTLAYKTNNVKWVI
ncbi:MAG: leucyl/phenylalanyl-tRNA--protein transferase [Mariprofundales bacterium]